ncbi:hypothetical protein O9K51_08771 [Purpureocillium lavendulum]|uniref:Uncharacterized protein n=1 Tax=Purpureocillium lavendulum TaxID=1247861 RepID=A0AB34FIQ0_9HYPO|nr:hypothetical protein O9K51_08771 [Purpureocillium lavendulum]
MRLAAQVPILLVVDFCQAHLAPSGAPAPVAIDVDVAIIGGGSSGIHAAIRLKDAGAKVVVIEKKSQIGGHAETYRHLKTGILSNVGVVLFENTEIVKNYFARLRVPMGNHDQRVGPKARESYDFSTGLFIPEPNSTTSAAIEKDISNALHAFSKNILSKYPWVDEGYFLPEPIPEELTVPFGQMALRYNFTALLPTIARLNWYAGNISTIPALYGIKSFGHGLLRSFTSHFIVCASGNTRTLYDAAAAALGDTVLLNAMIIYANRQNGGSEPAARRVSLVVQQPNEAPKHIRARKLLVAIPPTAENIRIFDLSESERSLFSKFSALGYVTGVAELPGLNSSLENVGAFTPYHMPVIPGSIGLYKLGFPNGYQIGVAFDGVNYAEADAQAIVRKELHTLGAVGAVPPDSSRVVTFPFVSNHAPYNMRVSGEEIGKGFYRELLGLQGTRNTYWTGATFAGHNSGVIWRWNEGVVLPALKNDLQL